MTGNLWREFSCSEIPNNYARRGWARRAAGAWSGKTWPFGNSQNLPRKRLPAARRYRNADFLPRAYPTAKQGSPRPSDGRTGIATRPSDGRAGLAASSSGGKVELPAPHAPPVAIALKSRLLGKTARERIVLSYLKDAGDIHPYLAGRT